MRVALVHDWLTGMRGGEKVLEELCRLFPGAPIHTLFHFPGTVSELIESHPIRTSFLQGAPRLREAYRSYLPLFPAAIQDFDLGDFDLVISSSHCVAKACNARLGAQHVCYCHTPMRYAWDQRSAYFPDRSGIIARARHRVLDWLQIWDVRTSPRVDLFIANSRFVRDRIRRYYDRDAEVVAPPVDVDFFTPGETPSAAAPFALSFAALAPYKKLDQAIEACRRLDLELRVVGGATQDDPGGSEPPPGVRRLGRVSDSELRDLYRQATCFVQPGVEDFGITTVEALACGCPVVAVAEGGVLDIVEPGEHGILYGVDEGVDGLVAAVDKIPRMNFNKLNLSERAQRFSPARFRQRVQTLLHRLDDSREPGS